MMLSIGFGLLIVKKSFNIPVDGNDREDRHKQLCKAIVREYMDLLYYTYSHRKSGMAKNKSYSKMDIRLVCFGLQTANDISKNCI